MKDSCGIAYLYTLYTDATNVYYGVDVEATEDVSYLGDPFADSYEELKSVFDRLVDCDQVSILRLINIILAVAALSIIISTITRGLQKVDDKIYEIVHNEGDLTQKLDIHSGDEMELIAGNVNALLEYIRGIMLKISDNSEHLNGSSQKIA